MMSLFAISPECPFARAAAAKFTAKLGLLPIFRYYFFDACDF